MVVREPVCDETIS